MKPALVHAGDDAPRDAAEKVAPDADAAASHKVTPVQSHRVWTVEDRRNKETWAAALREGFGEDARGLAGVAAALDVSGTMVGNYCDPDQNVDPGLRTLARVADKRPRTIRLTLLALIRAWAPARDVPTVEGAFLALSATTGTAIKHYSERIKDRVFDERERAASLEDIDAVRVALDAYEAAIRSRPTHE